VKVNPDNTACIEIAVDVSDLVHLERVKKSILKVKDVISVKRQLFRSSRNTATSELDSI
jgi:(p)ppGpp synthase/HD superfamily hydrolase